MSISTKSTHKQNFNIRQIQSTSNHHKKASYDALCQKNIFSLKADIVNQNVGNLSLDQKIPAASNKIFYPYVKQKDADSPPQKKSSLKLSFNKEIELDDFPSSTRKSTKHLQQILCSETSIKKAQISIETPFNQVQRLVKSAQSNKCKLPLHTPKSSKIGSLSRHTPKMNLTEDKQFEDIRMKGSKEKEQQQQQEYDQNSQQQESFEIKNAKKVDSSNENVVNEVDQIKLVPTVSIENHENVLESKNSQPETSSETPSSKSSRKLSYIIRQPTKISQNKFQNKQINPPSQRDSRNSSKQTIEQKPASPTPIDKREQDNSQNSIKQISKTKTLEEEIKKEILFNEQASDSSRLEIQSVPLLYKRSLNLEEFEQMIQQQQKQQEECSPVIYHQNQKTIWGIDQQNNQLDDPTSYENEILSNQAIIISSSEPSIKSDINNQATFQPKDEKQPKKYDSLKMEADMFEAQKGELLGQGAYGKVYKGFLKSTGIFVAIKEMTQDSLHENSSTVFFDDICREIQVLKNLKHKNIVSYYGSRKQERTIYIYMEYMRGGSISEMLKKFGPFGEQIIQKFVKQLLEGLVYLHSKGTIHRDLKGANVLSDGQGNVKLADFGASRHIENIQQYSLSQSEFCSSIKGSFYWMAPELIKNQKYGRRIDVWSLGCTIIEMATGQHPWVELKKFSDLAQSIINELPIPVPEHLSEECKHFIQSCCTYDMKARPQSKDLLDHPFFSKTFEDL